MRILCVDDDRLVLAVTADLIRSMGHDVIEARGGREGAKALRENGSIEVLITDIGMPDDLSGIELARYAREALPNVKIIFFSGLDFDPGDLNARLLRKPCTLRELRQAIAGVAPAKSLAPCQGPAC